MLFIHWRKSFDRCNYGGSLITMSIGILEPVLLVLTHDPNTQQTEAGGSQVLATLRCTEKSDFKKQ